MRAFIYTGGNVTPEFLTEHPKNDDITIAADSGYRNALRLGDKVQVLVGDFDSLGEKNIPEGVELIRLKPEKDVTDTQVAVAAAIDRGADDIIIIGGVSGRLDHTISNLAILEDLYLGGINAVITDGINRVRFCRNSSVLIGKSYYRYLSIICADEKVRGVSADGCKYPLKNAVLERRNQYAISNELSGNCAMISVKKGGIYIIESRDPA
ncbi:MAG: thiamine diphosphokinase [Clostridia bacterium]|nr:thiamine diphosphokinase [Clostridia bacterium]